MKKNHGVEVDRIEQFDSLTGRHKLFEYVSYEDGKVLLAFKHGKEMYYLDPRDMEVRFGYLNTI